MFRDTSFDYYTWKWKCLHQRRVFIFPVLSLFLILVWIFTISHVSRHCQMVSEPAPCDRPNMFYVMGLGVFFLTLHIMFLVATISSQWGVELLSDKTMGIRLCLLLAASWVTLIFLFAKGILFWILTDFERGMAIASFTTIGLTIFHHTGLTLSEISLIVFGMILSWIELEKYQSGVLIFIWVSALFLSLFSVVMQEAEYRRYYEFLKNTSMERHVSQEGEYKDIVSTVDAVLAMIAKLEYDVRDRVKKALMTSHRRGAGLDTNKISENPTKTHHPGVFYQIESLCNAITIFLLQDVPDKMWTEISHVKLSHLCGLLFQAFEDSASPRMVPLFFERNAGDLFMDIEQKVFQTILFLILFDSVASNSPGFCSIAFEQPDSLHSLRVVVTRVIANPGFEKKRTSQKSQTDSDKNLIKQLLPIQNLTNEKFPQVWLADRLAKLYLKSRIVPSAPEIKGGLSTFSWTLDLSQKNFSCTTGAVDVIDAKGYAYTWRIFEKSHFEEKKTPTQDNRSEKYAKFKNELNSLKVTYSVCHTTSRLDKELGIRSNNPQSKIGVIHEQILLSLEDREIEYILSVAVDLIILADGEVKHHEPSYFFSQHPVTFSRKEWSTEFRKAVRLRVSAEITASEFFEAFKHIRKSNRLDPVSDRDQGSGVNRVIYPAISTARKGVEAEEMNGLILKSTTIQTPVMTANAGNPSERPYPDHILSEPISYSQLWHNSIDGWLSDEVNFIEGTFNTLEHSACISFELINKIKAHAMIREHSSELMGGRALYVYLMQYYAKPLTTLQNLIDLVQEFTDNLAHTDEEPEIKSFQANIRLNLQYLIERFRTCHDFLSPFFRTAYDDLDFLNLWLQVIQAMISEEFGEHLGEIIKLVIPNMISIAENAIWGIPEVMESSWQLWEDV